MNKNREEIKEFLRKLGIEIVGFSAVPDDIEKLEIEFAYPRAVVLGCRLSKSVLSTIKDRPTLIYKHHYKTVNWILDQTAYRLADLIQKKGYSALPIPASQTIDWKHQRGHLSHQRLAIEAGLGFRGRSGLLIHPEYGAGVRYASILTDLEFPVGEKTEDECGSCQKCVEVCPAKAITKEGCDISVCLDQLKAFAKIRGIGQYICGVCVKVCDGSH